ncbi:alpha/beta fold hydrolase [Pseudomonas lalucatii]|uniref:Alpha/beta fold hydrolase n=1 Tax=Pseudomonas lalucatii TaxID=1424203 RepID=A0ABS5Q4V3_9PSED|nr:alpha/beta fold hydrolase [Pseudomonas lalucatii]MBS7663605.1 alpha/beta fold hydrolase [Pseudomonas lalucatii]MBS7725111.1 alpha/beta fold hydrolase [Pseudomonas lalucatii]QVM86923.1 alpha/beta fold hydrolase [Pseudomonas lalucatii]
MKTLPTFHHEITGKAGAPWLTFIPGIGNDADFWADQAKALSQHFRVLRFDPWGHGRSPEPPHDCRFDDIRDGVVQLWDQLGITRSGVVGLGFGGSLALALGLAYPARVERIAAFCCRPRQPDDRRDFWQARCEAAQVQGMDKLADITVDRWLSAAFRADHPQVDQLLRRMMKGTTLAGYLAYVRAFIEMDFSAQFAELQVPTLLVAGEHDHGGGPVADMQAMNRQNPYTTLAVLEGVGHICNHEAPAEVERLLRQFFLD